MVEEQFSIFGNGESVSLKRISFRIFVKDFFLVPLHFAMQLLHVILTKAKQNVSKFIA